MTKEIQEGGCFFSSPPAGSDPEISRILDLAHAAGFNIDTLKLAGSVYAQEPYNSINVTEEVYALVRLIDKEWKDKTYSIQAVQEVAYQEGYHDAQKQYQDKLDNAIKLVRCWSCYAMLTEDEISANDGFCPGCMAEISDEE